MNQIYNETDAENMHSIPAILTVQRPEINISRTSVGILIPTGIFISVGRGAANETVRLYPSTSNGRSVSPPVFFIYIRKLRMANLPTEKRKFRPDNTNSLE